MAVHVTRCPHCRTTFRVRDEHLKVANGAVRCGSCLQVFKAADHFVSEDQLQQEATPAAPASPSQKQEDVLIHDGMDDDTLIHDNMDDDDLIHDDMNNDDVPDEISDDPMFDFGIRAPDKLDRPAPRSDLEIDSSIFDLKDASSDTLDLLDPEADNSTRSGLDPDEAWADALLDDDDGDVSLGGLNLSDSSDFSAPDHNDDEFSHFKAGAEEDDFDGFVDEDDSFHLGNDDLGSEATEINVTSAITELQEDPLEFRQSAGGRSVAWGWALAALLMILVAAGQTLYFKFDEWSRTPQWRGFYGMICTQLNCQLPAIQNLRQMTTQHLVVRSHPKLQKALVVDTLLQNQADYAQPFPDLELVFSDLNDNVVASRRFLPAEYLSGELAGQKLMPSYTPIHVALEIVDPGPEAVSYAIRLRSNQ